MRSARGTRRGWLLAAAVGTGALVAFPGVASGGAYRAVQSYGSVQSSPDATSVRGFEEMNVVVRGVDGFYVSKWLGSFWTAWEPIGAPPGGAVGDPAIVSWDRGRLDVFVRGADNKLWQRFQSLTGVWSPWIKPVGDDGVLGSSPEASSRGGNRLDVFVLGTDARVYQRVFENDRWNNAWLDQGEPAGTVGLVGEPSSASWDSTRVDLFARGTDNKLWSKTWNGATWSAWAQPVGLDGTLASSPEATSGGIGHLQVFVRGTDGVLYSNELRGTVWRGWVRESILGAPGDVFFDTPGVTAREINRVTAFVRGQDNLAYQYE